jgi:hypothetical protein
MILKQSADYQHLKKDHLINSFYQIIMNIKNRLNIVSLLLLTLLITSGKALAEGTRELSPTANDTTMLHTNAAGFGDFASFASFGTTSALNVRISDFTTEKLYIGLSAEADDFGMLPATGGTYTFRILDPTGAVAFGPFVIGVANDNADTWSEAFNGPDILGMGGYSTDTGLFPYSMFMPTMNGDYTIQFDDGTPFNIVNVLWYDFTVAIGTDVQEGRLWSRNWALRTPPVNANTPPECQFDREFNGEFYSYTMDGFVSHVVFNNSGFQGLSFTVSFGDRGPGDTGDVLEDRRSVKGMNATANNTEHQIFLNEPDLIEFPSSTDQCGDVTLLGVTCITMDSFCIEIGVTQPGQVEILLDFNNNGVYDTNSVDVFLAMLFTEADTACLPWNGMMGNGQPIGFGDDVPAMVKYSQGVQHYAAFDVEFLKNGFCVNTVRPICTGIATDVLYWDDSEITDDVVTVTIDEGDPGTGQPKVQFNGCTCGVGGCRTWDNFQIGDPPTGTCVGTPFGYGENNTLNTWWFANTVIIDDILLPFAQVIIVGDSAICAGTETEFCAVTQPDTVIFEYNWSGPGGFTADTECTGPISVAGTYSVTVTDPIHNCSAIDSHLLIVIANPVTSLTFTCVGPNQQNANIDLTVSGGQPPYTYLWSNGATTQDLTNVPPGTYSVIVTDATGCQAFDTITVSGCCELIVSCPPANGGTFTCVTSVPAPNNAVVTVVEYCDSFVVTNAQTDNGGTGCANSPLVITRTYTATDATGATATCVQTFTVVDNVVPTITCPANTTIACTASTLPAATGTATATDNCDATVTISSSDVIIAGACPQESTINRTWLATDDCGNTSTCLQTIVVDDSVPPAIVCPGNVTVACGGSTLPASTGTATATDNCGGTPTISSSDVVTPGACTAENLITRTWTATDPCGNSSTCVQLISVDDTTPPVIVCPGDATIECTESTLPANTGTATATDNCIASPIITFTDVTIAGQCPLLLTINRTWSATDGCGNTSTCLQAIQVIDSGAPAITCPSNVTIQCTVSTLPGSTGTATATDNCDATPTVTFADVSIAGGCTQEGSIQRTWTAEDDCGNTSTCVQTIVIDDSTTPAITCPTNVTIACTASTLPASTGTATATDNCDATPTITSADVVVAGACPQEQTIFRTWAAMDDCGNSSTCVQTIFVDDFTPPAITCPSNMTISCTVSTLPANTGTASATDNCGGTPTITSVDAIIPGACPQEQTINRTWTATDPCGNTSTCLQVIIVDDSNAPVITCPGDVTLECMANTLPAATGTATAIDDCDGTPAITFTDVVTQGPCAQEMTVTRTWVATDDCGNAASCVQVIGSMDNTPPVAVCQNVTIDFGSGNTATIDPSDVDGGSTDNCGGLLTFALSDSSFSCEEFVQVNSLPVTLIVTDECGNSSTCVAQVFGVGGVLEINCPTDIIVYLGAGQCEAFVNYTVTADAICGGTPTIMQIDPSGLTSGDAFPIGVTEQCYIATNNSDTDTCCFTITVIEFDVPVVMACNDTINLSVDANCQGHLFVDMILEGDQYGCYDDFIITIDSIGTDTGWVVFDAGEFIGGCYTVTITDPETGNSCWGTVCVEDKLAPQIICACPPGDPEGDTCTISCLQVELLEAGNIPPDLYPTIIDNCGYTLEVADIVVNDVGCGEGTVIITWLVSDFAGHSATCEQQFNIEPLSPDSLVFPPNYVGPCGSSSDPDVTGWPQIGGIDLTDEAGLCNLFVGYWDKALEDCGGGQKILRTWTVLDWCTLELIEHAQIIKLSDEQGPELDCPNDFTVGTDFWYCYANVSVPKPIAEDNCSDVVSFSLFSADGIVVQYGNNFVVNGLLIGEHELIWTVTDLCGNSSTCEVIITVIDNVVPVATCDQHTIVSLTNDGPGGVTLVPASVFDDGSYDNCGPVTFRARRMDSCIDFDWTTDGGCVDDIPNGQVDSRDRGTVLRPCVPFSCCDIPRSAPLNGQPIMVELEVTDAAGNKNYCMVEVEVQDKLAPFIECPPDISVSCDFWFPVIEGTYRDAFGNANGNLDEDPLSAYFGNMFDALSNNDDESVRQPIYINDPGNHNFPQPHLWGFDGWADDNCIADLEVRVRVYSDCSGDGLPGNPPPGAVKLIERRFTARDNPQGFNPAVCTQHIWVVDFTPFYIDDNTCFNDDPNDGVIWPCDIIIDNCPDDLGNTGEPQVFADACSLIGITYEDTRFEFADGACYKILREWKIIDWCQYNAATGYGLWEYTQVIKVHDDEGPEFLDCPAQLTLCVEDPGVRLPANNQAFLGENDPNASSCSVHVTLTHRIREACNSQVKYDVKLYPFNGTSFLQVVPTTIATLDQNHEGDLVFNSEESPILSIRQDGIPYNSIWCGDYHRVLWSVEDGCGNWSHCEYLLRLEDCKQPSPVCIQGLSTVVMPVNCEVTLWARDFNASSFDDCTPADELLYSFSADAYEPSRVFNSTNIPAFGVELAIQIWAADNGTDHNCNGSISWDERNKDYCTTTVVFTDNSGNCDLSGEIVYEGEILTYHSHAVEGVNVSLQRDGDIMTSMTTADNGRYIVAVPQVDDERYMIVPKRLDQPRNGVSTLDLVQIQKHLLGKELFASPYQLIAADANSSAGVSAIDLVEIRKLILGIYVEFPNSPSWKFVEKNFQFADVTHPWPFENEIDIQYNGTSVSNLDFIGVKVGDVNNSVLANATQVLPRNGNRVVKVDAGFDRMISAGESVDVTFTIPESVMGAQWTLEAPGLDFVGVESNVIRIADNNIGVLDNNLITLSWHAEDLVAASKTNAVVITMQFVAAKSGRLADMLHMSNAVARAEAYTWSEEVVDLSLSFDSVEKPADFALYQNEPNPWSGSTVISFDLPEASRVKLSLFDMTGSLINVLEGDYSAGKQSMTISRKDVLTQGVLYYRLDAGNYSASKKMIHLE